MDDQSKASNLDTDKFPQFAVNRGADPFNVTNHEGSENPDNHELSQVTTTPKGQRLTTHARESLLRHGFSQPVTGLRNIRPQELERLGLRYGFNPNPAN